MQITYFLTACKNIDFDQVCHVIMYKYFSYSCSWLYMYHMNKITFVL